MRHHQDDGVSRQCCAGPLAVTAVIVEAACALTYESNVRGHGTCADYALTRWYHGPSHMEIVLRGWLRVSSRSPLECAYSLCVRIL